MKLRFIQPEFHCKSTVNPNHLLIQEISRNCSSNSASLCKTDTLFVIYAHCVSWCKSLFYAQNAHAQTQSFTPTPLNKPWLKLETHYKRPKITSKAFTFLEKYRHKDTSSALFLSNYFIKRNKKEHNIDHSYFTTKRNRFLFRIEFLTYFELIAT